MSWDRNIYYYPDKHGLEIVVEGDDPDASYSFDMFVVWRRIADGDLFYAIDSGCSCPSPFEDYDDVSELTPLVDTPESIKEFNDAVDEWLLDCHYKPSERLRQMVEMERHEVRMAAFKALDGDS